MIKTEVKDLYLSFGTLAKEMRQGNVQPGDLEQALFAFGVSKNLFDITDIRSVSAICDAYGLIPREYVGVKTPRHEEDLEGAQRTYDTIKAAVLRADSEGRAVWRTTYESLNRLLEQNGVDVSGVQDLEHEGPIYLSEVARRYQGLVNVKFVQI